MRHAQQINYARRIDRVVAYLEAADLNEPPALVVLAAEAGLSPYHFHRVFRLMTGERLGDVIRRVRLARSLPTLRASQSSVTEAAAMSGYTTSQAFAKALRAVAGLSASEVRRGPGDVERLSEKLLKPIREAGLTPPLTVEIVSTEPFKLLAVRNVGNYAELDQAYERLFGIVFERYAFDRLAGVYGIPHDDPRFDPPAACVFDCAVDVGEDAETTGEAAVLILPPGDHLRIRHIGSYAGLQESIDLLYAAAIQMHQELGPHPAWVHYVDTPESAPEEALRSDIYLPLQKEPSQ